MKTRIRWINDDEMPFDKEGRHATGREVYNESLDGHFHWDPEYEGDETEDMDVTED